MSRNSYKDPRIFKIYRDRKGSPRWFQPWLEAFWIVTGRWSLHRAWQDGLDHGSRMEYERTVINEEIKTEHNGHDVTYNEGSEVCECRALDCSSPKLSALRTKINKIDAQDRCVDNVRAVTVERSYGYSGSRIEGVVTLTDDVDSVWFSEICGNKSRRSKKRMSDLAPDTPEARAAIARYEKAMADVKEANRLANEARAAIPRLTREYLTGIPKAERDETA